MEDKNFIKVLITADTVGGVWSYTVDLIRSSLGYPVQFYLATLGAFPDEFQLNEIEQLENVTLFQKDFKLEWMDNCWDDVENTAKWLNMLCKEIKPDVIHLNNFSPAFIDAKVPVMTVIHSCVLSWWEAVKGEQAPDEWSKYRSLVGLVFHSSDLVVAPSKGMMQVAERMYGEVSKKRVIHNGRNPELYKAVCKEPLIVSIGRIWDEAKNIALLAEAAADLDWPVVVIGEEKNPSTGCRVSFPNIFFTGTLPQSEIAGWLARASIYVAPAKYEPFGLAVVEAAMSGCTLVTGEIDTMEELWGNSAMHVNVHDSGELRHKLNILTENPELREGFAGRSSQQAHKYTSERMARTYFDTYLELTGIAPQKNTGQQKETILNQFI